ncbi:WD repeat-containing protein 44-like isoform X3 [Apostichopus japonicus]|uniref:WD repeat-containing protein 44-like isoform X3 n=1 Tax=Stichopus japonicus TaxID=307972 RepID=UPI003AB38915
MSDSDSEEFYDASDDQPSKPIRNASRQSSVGDTSNTEKDDTFDLEVEKLKEEQKKAEERRRLEDEAIQEKLRELERRKREKEEQERQRLEEEKIRQEKERAEQRELEKQQRRREQEEATERRLEAERRRKRLEQIRDNEQSDSAEEDSTKEIIKQVEATKEIKKTIEDEATVIAKEPQTRSSPEPDLVAMTKTNKVETAIQESMPPPVAPPRRRKKKKTAVEGLKKPDTLSLDSMSVSSLPSLPGDDISMDVVNVGTGLPSENEPKDVLTPTTTIESITKELEYSLDLASAVHGGGVIHHMDTRSIKGDSKAEVERAREGKKGFDEKQKKNTPDAETLMQYDHLMKEGMSAQGTQLTDEEVLALVMVKNLDTGEKVSLLKAEDQLPQCVNPLALHIMRLTSEYVSNNSLDKEDISEGEKEEDAKDSPRFKKKGKRLKKFLSKTASKIKHKADEQFHKEEELSEEESLPDIRSVKFKASSSNKGPHDFDQLKFAQDMSGVHTGAVWTMKFSPCGRLLATGGQDHFLRVWVLKDHFTYFDDMRQKYNNQQQTPSDETTPESEKQTTETVTEEDYADLSRVGNSEDVSDPVSSANIELAVFATSPFCTYTGHTADLLDISWSKNYFLLSSSMDKMVRLWHISRTECLCCFQHIDFVTAIAFHPKDDRYFLSGSLDGKLRLWNIPDKRVALWNEIDGPTKLITAANFIQNGRFSAIGTYDGRCIFYDTEHLKYYTQIHVRSTRGRNSKGRKITAIEPLPGQDKILITSNDSRVRLYDLRDLSLSCKYKGALNLSSQIRASFSHTYKYIISGSEDHCVYIWKTSYDFGKFTSVRRDRNDYWESFKAHDAVVTAVVFSPNPSLVLNRIEEGKASRSTDPVREKCDGKLELSEEKTEKRSSLKKMQDQSEVIISADFSGTIKVFIRKVKEKD